MLLALSSSTYSAMINLSGSSIMPLQPWTNVISVDDHLVEQHPTAWRDRLPRDEARDRLAAEIESESAALAALGTGPRGRADVQLRLRRLSALKIALSHL
jgi:hypothetical protein